MIFVAICSLAALTFYGMGFYIGRLYAEQKIHEQRKEMQIDEDEWGKLFKED